MISIPSFSDLRLRVLNSGGVNPDGGYILYWMISARRMTWNFALQRATDWARQLGVGIVILEPLRCDYPWASDRLHRFVIEGMIDNAKAATLPGVTYFPYVELKIGNGRGLLEAVASHASLVVTDDAPHFFFPRMLQAAAEKLPIRLEAVDSNGLLPMDAADKTYPTAYAFRRLLQKALPAFLDDRPDEAVRLAPDVTRPKIPPNVLRKWPMADLSGLLAPNGLSNLPIDHQVCPVSIRGGTVAATEQLQDFLEQQLDHYQELRNSPDHDATSRLSPYLHFGHISPHQILEDLACHETWDSSRLSLETRGKKSGWWRMSPSAEAFLDELVTWRELGFNLYRHQPGPEDWTTLPEWAKNTLQQHADDERPTVYTLEQFRDALTHDPLWNAAQRQLLREGRIHGYLRMLWGKKILEWSPTPRLALEIMLELNNRYALDGRDPNSTSGVTWCLGRFDRAWGPERRIFGKIRYMTSANTARKTSVTSYLERYAE
ncbi:MAG: deoxyribodipyrimidine photolyase [Desulfuromonas sp.]|nr:MAG: deoxyribodipyrimidine photolyase [Desulfuromonas sp.]